MDKMISEKIFLTIHSTSFVIAFQSIEIANFFRSRISFEYNFFITSEENCTYPIEITLATLTSENRLKIIPPNLIPVYQRQNSITYDSNNIRYNNYYDKTISCFDYRRRQCTFYIQDLQKGFEVLYLFLQSISGKALDLRGIHKIHAFAFLRHNKGLVCMMPMKGGKSTLFHSLVVKNDIQTFFYSDDAPLIDKKLNLRINPMPVHLIPGYEKVPDTFQTMEFDREHYGKKISYLIPEEKLAKPTKSFILVEARRSTYHVPKKIKVGFLGAVKILIPHCLIGIGLPIIFEYFWMSGWRDFFTKTEIFFSRLQLILKLALTKKFYIVYLCSDASKNSDFIEKLLEEG